MLGHINGQQEHGIMQKNMHSEICRSSYSEDEWLTWPHEEHLYGALLLTMNHLHGDNDFQQEALEARITIFGPRMPQQACASATAGR